MIRKPKTEMEDAADRRKATALRRREHWGGVKGYHNAERMPNPFDRELDGLGIKHLRPRTYRPKLGRRFIKQDT